MLIDLLRQDGLDPRHKGHGEHCSPCPACGGSDRLVSHADTNRYWCRQCGSKGDVIQYLRQFRKMTFKEAASFAGKVVPLHTGRTAPAKRQEADRTKNEPTPEAWTAQAEKLITWAHKTLLGNATKLEWLKTGRGLTRATAERFRLGWIERDLYLDRAAWGLPEALKDGKVKKLFFPAGLVIPGPDRIRIRRAERGEWGKYFVLPGSGNAPLVIGCEHRFDVAPGIIVESELDAILLAQELDHRPLLIVATGSTSNGPGPGLLADLECRPFVLIGLDNDEAGGKAAWQKWAAIRNAARTPIPATWGKDPSEAHLAGHDLKAWLAAAYQLILEEGVK